MRRRLVAAAAAGALTLGACASAAPHPVFSRDRVDLGSPRAIRIPQVEREVRFRSGRTWLAGTLAVNAGAGRRPGVVLVHGSGATTRNDPAVLAAYFEAQGFAVLTYDKRGVGQSGGEYPGEAATDASIDYALDVAAAARFLAAQPEVDRARVGLAGSSQAGWIAPVAAVHEPAVRFLTLVLGPDGDRGRGERVRVAHDPGPLDSGGFPRRDPRPGAPGRPERLRPGARPPAAGDPVALALRLARPARADRALCRAPRRHRRRRPRLPACRPLPDRERARPDREDLRSDRYADGAFLALGSWLAAHGLR